MSTSIQKGSGSTSNKSKLQLKYEKLLQQIETEQLYNANLRDGLHKAQVKVSTELSPLTHQQYTLLRELIIVLDQLAVEIGLGRYNREWFDKYMAEEAEQLLDVFGYQDKELSGLLEKYGQITIDDLANDEDTVNMAQTFSKVFGFDINIKEMLEKGHQAYFTEHQSDFMKNMPDAEQETYSKKGKPNSSVMFGSKDEGFAKDARNIYMRLIKKYHPDIEPDEEKRIQKNEIVKEVTSAYQENDFFGLLKLQVKYLDDNEAEAATVAEDMLKRYTKILQKQLNALKQQINSQYHISGSMIEDYIDKNGNFSPQKFAAQRRELEKSIKIITQDLASSRKKPKTWFKEYIRYIKDLKHQEMVEDMFANIFNI